MVFEPDATTDSGTTNSTSGQLDVVETADRVATLLSPLVDMLSVLVQTLTAYALLRKL